MIMLNMLDARIPKGVSFDAIMATPTYASYRQSIDTGELQLATDEGQQLYAQVILNEARRNMQSPRFEQALARVQQPNSLLL
jgi:hypothetical protein